MRSTRLLPAVVLSAFATALLTPSAYGAPAADRTVSANWSGYSATGAQFSRVSGTWVQPAASCDGGAGDAAFWVGLGGADQQSQKLEQAGTEVNCSDGTPTYSAWYELVPAAPVQFDELTLSPGDTVSTTVAVDGDQVSISMTDETTGKTADRKLQMADPDASSAEWIAEAPSSCVGGATGSCQPVALADFGKVGFARASATAGGHSGSISDDHWAAQAIQLSPSAGARVAGGGFGAYDQNGSDATAQASAIPSELSAGGTQFSVAWQAGDAGHSATPDPVIVPDTGGGYGYGDGSGGYGDGSGGYGDGSGGYGWGDGYGYGGAGYGYGGGYGY